MTKFIYYVDTDALCTLFRLGNGKFKQLENHNDSLILIGYNYVLVEVSLYKYLESLSIEGIKFSDAEIIDNQVNSSCKSYVEMYIKHEFSSSEIDNIGVIGDRIYLMDKQYLFVTHDLKEKLLIKNFKLSFSLGLTDFG